MRLRRCESGQAIVEYVGIVLAVAALLLALATLDLGPKVAHALAGSVCEVVTLASCRPEEPESSRAQRLRLVNRYVQGGLDDFLRYRGSPDRERRLDYSTDRCSAPILGSRGLGYDFIDACVRHDFAYRNYKRLGLFRRVRKAVDRIFLRDMSAHCGTRSLILQPRCHQRALQYYAGVRAFGGRR